MLVTIVKHTDYSCNIRFKFTTDTIFITNMIILVLLLKLSIFNIQNKNYVFPCKKNHKSSLKNYKSTLKFKKIVFQIIK